MSSGRGLNGGGDGLFFLIAFSVALYNINQSFYVDSQGNLRCSLIQCTGDITSGGTITATQYIQTSGTGIFHVDNQGNLRCRSIDCLLDILAGGSVTASQFIQNTGTGTVDLEAQIVTLQGQVSTLQSQVATLQGQVSTLQGQVTTLQSQVSTLQSEMTSVLALPLPLACGDIDWNGVAYTVALAKNCTVTTNPGGMVGTQGIIYTGTPPASIEDIAFANAKSNTGIVCEVTQNVTIGPTLYNIVIQTYNAGVLTDCGLVFTFM